MTILTITYQKGDAGKTITAVTMARGLDEYNAGVIDLQPYLRISRCARFE